MFNLRHCYLILAAASVLLAACVTPAAPTPAIVPTEPPTATPVPPTVTAVPPTATLLPPTATPVPPTNTAVPTATPVPPTDTLAPTATSTRKPITVTPRATATAKPPKAPPLGETITRTRLAIEAIGGQMDRMYGGQSGSCTELRANYSTVVNAPTYDVGAQSSNVQGAYNLYRQAIAIIVERISPYDKMCAEGGGSVGKLAFDVARGKINEAASMLTNAFNMIAPQ